MEGENGISEEKYNNIKLQIKALFIIQKKKKDGIPVEVIPNLYIGSVGAAFNRSELNKNGITHIISLYNYSKLWENVKFVIILASIFKN